MVKQMVKTGGSLRVRRAAGPTRQAARVAGAWARRPAGGKRGTASAGALPQAGSGVMVQEKLGEAFSWGPRRLLMLPRRRLAQKSSSIARCVVMRHAYAYVRVEYGLDWFGTSAGRTRWPD